MQRINTINSDRYVGKRSKRAIKIRNNKENNNLSYTCRDMELEDSRTNVCEGAITWGWWCWSQAKKCPIMVRGSRHTCFLQQTPPRKPIIGGKLGRRCFWETATGFMSRIIHFSPACPRCWTSCHCQMMTDDRDGSKVRFSVQGLPGRRILSGSKCFV